MALRSLVGVMTQPVMAQGWVVGVTNGSARLDGRHLDRSGAVYKVGDAINVNGKYMVVTETASDGRIVIVLLRFVPENATTGRQDSMSIALDIAGGTVRTTNEIETVIRL